MGHPQGSRASVVHFTEHPGGLWQGPSGPGEPPEPGQHPGEDGVSSQESQVGLQIRPGEARWGWGGCSNTRGVSQVVVSALSRILGLVGFLWDQRRARLTGILSPSIEPV